MYLCLSVVLQIPRDPSTSSYRKEVVSKLVAHEQSVELLQTVLLSIQEEAPAAQATSIAGKTLSSAGAEQPVAVSGGDQPMQQQERDLSLLSDAFGPQPSPIENTAAQTERKESQDEEEDWDDFVEPEKVESPVPSSSLAADEQPSLPPPTPIKAPTQSIAIAPNVVQLLDEASQQGKSSAMVTKGKRLCGLLYQHLWDECHSGEGASGGGWGWSIESESSAWGKAELSAKNAAGMKRLVAATQVASLWVATLVNRAHTSATEALQAPTKQPIAVLTSHSRQEVFKQVARLCQLKSSKLRSALLECYRDLGIPLTFNDGVWRYSRGEEATTNDDAQWGGSSVEEKLLALRQNLTSDSHLSDYINQLLRTFDATALCATSTFLVAANKEEEHAVSHKLNELLHLLLEILSLLPVECWGTDATRPRLEQLLWIIGATGSPAEQAAIAEVLQYQSSSRAPPKDASATLVALSLCSAAATVLPASSTSQIIDATSQPTRWCPVSMAPSIEGEITEEARCRTGWALVQGSPSKSQLEEAFEEVETTPALKVKRDFPSSASQTWNEALLVPDL